MRMPPWLAALSLAYPAYKCIDELGFHTMKFEKYYTIEAVSRYLQLHCKQFGAGSRGYESISRFDYRNLTTNTAVWEVLTDAARVFLLPYTAIPVPVFAYRVTSETHQESLVVRYPWLLVDPDEFVRKVFEEYDKWYAHDHEKSSYRIARVIADDPGEALIKSADFDFSSRPGRLVIEPNIDQSSHASITVEDIPMSDAHTAVHNEVLIWRQSRSWYANRRLPWQRGYLLYGPPGTGKTSFVQAMARAIDANLFSMDLATFDNESFIESWEELSRARAYKVIMLEDIDAVFSGRRNIARKVSSGEDGASSGTLSWDCLLSVLDDPELSNGTLLFVTTNNPHKLDESLAKVDQDGTEYVRPGRIDKAVHFGALTRAQAMPIAERLLLNKDLAIETVSKLPESPTVAQVREACVHAALSALTRQ